MHNCCNLNFVHYADDTTVYTSGSDLYGVVDEINHEVASIDEWLKVNRLSLNTSKSKVMMISKRTILNCPDIVIGSESLDLTSFTKFLGVTLDDNVNFGVHGSNVISKLSRSLGV